MARKKIVKSSIGEENEMYKFLKLIIIVTVLFLVFYLLTLIINNKQKEADNNETTAQVQYDKILIGNILSQSNDKYYVLIESKDDNYTNSYGTYIDMYKEKDNYKRVYYADLDNPLNSKFKADESKTLVSKISDLKLKGTTLLYISNGKIIKAYEGHEDINKILAQLSSGEEK